MRTTWSSGTMARSPREDKIMYPHSPDLVRVTTEDRLRNSERHRQIASMFEGKRDRGGSIARIVGFRLSTRRARTSPAH